MKRFYIWGKSYNRRKHAKTFYVVIFLFVFFPFFIESVEASSSPDVLQIMDERVFCNFVFTEGVEQRDIKANIFRSETIFNKMNKRFLKLRIFFVKFFSFVDDGSLSDINQNKAKSTNNAEKCFWILVGYINNKINENHDDICDFLLFFVIPLAAYFYTDWAQRQNNWRSVAESTFILLLCEVCSYEV